MPHKQLKRPTQPISVTDVDSFEDHAKDAASKLDLTDLNLNERAFLGTCQDIYRNCRGTATPFETFVTTIIRWATWGNPPTPEALIEEIKTELEGDFEITLHSVKRFIGNYPDLISATPEPPAAEQYHPPRHQATEEGAAHAEAVKEEPREGCLIARDWQHPRLRGLLYQVRVPLHDPVTGKALKPHYKTVRGSQKIAQTYIDWYAGLGGAGNPVPIHKHLRWSPGPLPPK